MAIKYKLVHYLLRLLGASNCEEFDAMLYDYSEGNLSSRLRRAFERHLRICKPCMKILESYQKLRDLIRSESSPVMSDTFKENLKQNI